MRTNINGVIVEGPSRCRALALPASALPTAPAPTPAPTPTPTPPAGSVAAYIAEVEAAALARAIPPTPDMATALKAARAAAPKKETVQQRFARVRAEERGRLEAALRAGTPGISDSRR